jgi:hypothetical protein
MNRLCAAAPVSSGNRASAKDAPTVMWSFRPWFTRKPYESGLCKGKGQLMFWPLNAVCESAWNFDPLLGVIGVQN